MLQPAIPAFLAATIILLSVLFSGGHAFATPEDSGLQSRTYQRYHNALQVREAEEIAPSLSGRADAVENDDDYSFQIDEFGEMIDDEILLESLIIVLTVLANRGTPYSRLKSQVWQTDSGLTVDFNTLSPDFKHETAFATMIYVAKDVLQRVVRDCGIKVSKDGKLLGVLTIAHIKSGEQPPTVTLPQAAVARRRRALPEDPSLLQDSLVFANNGTEWNANFQAQVFSVAIRYNGKSIPPRRCLFNILTAISKIGYMALDVPVDKELHLCDYDFWQFLITFRPNGNKPLVPLLQRHVLIALSVTARKLQKDKIWQEWDELVKLNEEVIGMGLIEQIGRSEQQSCSGGRLEIH